MRAFQISNGLGAGNTGDELMARAFWAALPMSIELDVAIHAESAGQREPYPKRHRYVPVQMRGVELPGDLPGILAGDTPVTESEGIHYPMRFLAPRLERFHRRKLPVDAVGTGVDFLVADETRKIFHRAYLPIRSWTVRSPACRNALLSLGVAEDRIAVGADWAWLYESPVDHRPWAAELWRSLGVDLSRPLVVASVVNMIWLEDFPRRALAAALDELAVRHDAQIAFFCQESRPGDFFDYAAASDIQSRMHTQSVIAPREYYSAGEMLALLSHAAVVVAERYHSVVGAVLAGSVPVAIVRGQKMTSLLRDLGIAPAGSIDAIDRGRLVAAVTDALARRETIRESLSVAANALRGRAVNNLTFLKRYYPEAW